MAKRKALRWQVGMLKQKALRWLVGKKLVTPAPPPVIGAELQEKSTLNAVSAMALIAASVFQNAGANLTATSEIVANTVSVIKASVILNATSDVVASAVPFKAARFLANANSDIPTLQAKVNTTAAARLDGTSSIAARPTRIITMLPIMMNAAGQVTKAFPTIPPLVDGILIIGNPNLSGINI